MIVSFAVVAYNEEKTLPRLLEDICGQDYPHEKIEVLLIDSMSTDKTWEIMQEFAAREHDFLRVAVFKNEKKNIPCGHNVALRNFMGDALVRVDAHASVPTDFISRNVEVQKSGEMVTGGRRPNIIDGETPWKKTLLNAEQSMFGSSFASYRRSTEKMYSSSLFCPMIRREVFEKVGEYNELLPRSEDNDMAERIRSAGYKLCYCPNIVYYHHTRRNLKLMLRQKFLNGYWIGKTMGINPNCFSLFHFVPFCFVMAIIITAVLAAFGIWQTAALLWGVYTLFVVVNSVIEIIKNEFSLTNFALPVLFFLLHFCYGIGTVKGLIEMPFWVKKVKKNG